MNIIISNSSKEPIYEQIKEQIKLEILKDNLKIGEALPSLRVLAKGLQVSIITTKKAYEELEKEGFIEIIPGKGTFVAKVDKDHIKDKQLKKLEEVLKEGVLIGINNSISIEDMKTLLEKIYEEENYE